MVSQNMMSLKSRTETSARLVDGGRKRKAALIHQHTYSIPSALTTNTSRFKLHKIYSFPLAIIIRGLDESPMVFRFVRASIYRKLHRSKSGIYPITQKDNKS